MEIVLYVPRCASKFYSEQLAKEKGYENLGEIFNPRTYPITKQRQDVVTRACTDENIVCKVSLIMARSSDMLKKLVNNAKIIHVLYRRDINAQVRSFYAALEINNYHAQFDQERKVHYNKTKFNQATNYIIDRYKENAVFAAQQKNVNLIDAERFMTPDQKYNRPFVWDTEPPAINFNPAALFENKY